MTFGLSEGVLKPPDVSESTLPTPSRLTDAPLPALGRLKVHLLV